MDTLDSLMQRAHQNLSGYAPSQDEPDDEAMMDFLAGRQEFMVSIEQAAQTALGRRSHGVGDAEFEDAMVRFMDAVQRRMAYARLPDSVATVGGRGAKESGPRWKARRPGRTVPPPAGLPRVAIGAAAFATLAAAVAVITLLAVSSGGSGNSPVVLQVTAIPQASESVSTPIASKPVSTPAPSPAPQTPTPLSSPGSRAQVSAQPGEQGKLTAVTPPTGSAVEGQAARPTPASVAPKSQAVAAKAVPVLAPASAVVPVRAGATVTAAAARPAAASPAVLRPAPSTPKPAVGKAHPKKRNRPQKSPSLL